MKTKIKKIAREAAFASIPVIVSAALVFGLSCSTPNKPSTPAQSEREYRAYLNPDLVEGIDFPNYYNDFNWVMRYAHEGDQFDYTNIEGEATIGIVIPDSLASDVIHDYAFFLDEGYPIDELYEINVCVKKDTVFFNLVMSE